VAKRSSGNEGFGYLFHLDGGQNAGRDSGALEVILQSDGVLHCGEHPHIVGHQAIHALVNRRFHPAKEVSATDDDAYLDARIVNRAHFLRDAKQHLAINPKPFRASEGFAGKLD
jgi:hypothetical protein